MDAEILPKLSA